MKVTFSKDGTIAFEVNTTADAVALARALQNGTVPPSAPAAAVVPPVVAAFVEQPQSETLDFDEAAEVAESVLSNPPRRRGNGVRHVKKVIEDEQKGRIAAREMGLSYGQYMVWEYLVSQDSRKNGVTADMVNRRLPGSSRSASSQRLQKLTAKGYAERVSQGRYKAAIPGS